jgi:hypothetical protein
MKTIRNMFVVLAAMIMFAGTIKADEVKKEYHKSWPVNEFSTLNINNRFGEVKIDNNGGNEMTIDVVVTVEERNESRANDILDKINVTFGEMGKTVTAITSIENNMNCKGHFSIDYVVNIPSDKNLDITNKYGNTIVATLTGNGVFENKYGNFTASELKTPKGGDLSLELAYGNASIGVATDIYVEVSYSPIDIEEVHDLDLESKYSTISVDKCNDLDVESKYDKLKIGDVSSVDAEFRYSNIKIEKLYKDLDIHSGYGGIKVDQIAPDFNSIDVTNTYGRISLGLSSVSYSVDATCDYCDIDYPEEQFHGKRSKDGHTQEVIGKVGEGTGGNVKVKSRYGEIKLY